MQIDIASLLGDQGIQYSNQGKSSSSGWVNISCPLCGDSGDHGGFNIAGGYYHCWKCGGHELSYVLKQLLRVSYKEVRSLIFEYSGRSSVLSSLNESRHRISRVELPGGPLKSIHKKYLRSRGFDPELIENKYKVQGVGPAGDYKFRLIIPIIYQGEVMSFLGRDVTNKQKLRYRNLPESESRISPKKLLYGIDDCTDFWIGVVEGVFDQWRMGVNFCATLGTSLKEDQIKLLSQYEKIVFLFDPGRKAQKKAFEYAARLAALGKQAYVIDPEGNKDPAEMSERRAGRLRKRIIQL